MAYWKTLPTLPTAGTGSAICMRESEKVLLCQGSGHMNLGQGRHRDFQCQGHGKVYMNLGQEWIELPQPPWKNKHPIALMLANGKVLVGGTQDAAGGSERTQIWLSDNFGNSWKQGKSLDVWAASFAILWDGSVGSHYGTVLCMGVFKQRSVVLRSSNHGQSWHSAGSPEWTPRKWATAVACMDGSVLLLGGLHYGAIGSIGEVISETWRSADKGRRWMKLSQPPWPGRMHAMAVDVNDTIILFGGQSITQFYADVWISEDVGMSWHECPQTLWSPRSNAAVTVLPSGNILVLGGYTGSLSDDALCGKIGGEFIDEDLPGMNIHSGEAFVVDDCAKTKDLLNYGQISNALLNVISKQASNTPFTIGVYGAWGSGKSCFMNLVKWEILRSNAEHDALHFRRHCLSTFLYHCAIGLGKALRCTPCEAPMDEENPMDDQDGSYKFCSDDRDRRVVKEAFVKFIDDIGMREKQPKYSERYVIVLSPLLVVMWAEKISFKL